MTGADPAVVELFALLHDSGRRNDAWDPKHGPRAASGLDAMTFGSELRSRRGRRFH